MTTSFKTLAFLVAGALAAALVVRGLSTGGPEDGAEPSVSKVALPPIEGCPLPPPTQAPISFAGEELIPICADVYLEPAATAEERDFVRRGVAEATALVVSALGPLRSEPPVVIFCKTHPCQIYFTGPTRRSWSLPPGDQRKGATFVAGDRHTLIINDIASKGIKVAAHEITHVEVRARRRGQYLPGWFNEGLATWVGGEPDCDADLPDGIDDLAELDTSPAWNAYTDDPDKVRPTYCQARREIDTWARHHDGTFAGLLDAVGEGEAFDDVYGDLMTQ